VVVLARETAARPGQGEGRCAWTPEEIGAESLVRWQDHGANTMVPPPEDWQASRDGQDCRKCAAEMPNCLIFTCRVL